MVVNLEDIIFSLPLPLVLVDSRGIILEANQKFETLTNSSKKYIVGEKLSECLFSNPAHSRKIEHWLKKSHENCMEIHNLDIGSFRFFLSPLYSSGKETGTVILITHHERTLNENFSVFLKGLFHELRNPLTGIKGSAELILKLRKFDEDLAKVLIKEIERVERLINNINSSFDFSRINVKKLNIHKILNRILTLLKSNIKKTGIRINKEFDPTLPEIYVDEDRIIQAFLNILKNSLEAMEESTTKILTIRTGYSLQIKNFIYIKFKDTGKGMTSDELKSVFIPFYTLKEKGTGLGMYITKEIIESHGGKIEIESFKNKGTSVTVMLPMKRLT
jgi:two-component system nitrogen regulation sensor histidine kinase GlnL